jgi:hypothetical protein
MTDKPQKPIPMRYCFYCGAEIGRYRDYDRLDTCGEAECEREARYARDAERDEAHRQLDDDRGWS